MNFKQTKSDTKINPTHIIINDSIIDKEVLYAALIRATASRKTALELALEVSKKSPEEQDGFVQKTREIALDTQHFGSKILPVLIQTHAPFYTIHQFTGTKHYDILQTTMRGVPMENIICDEGVIKEPETRNLFNRMADLYLPIALENAKGRFHPSVQDAGQLVPCCVENDFTGYISLRGADDISRWRGNINLPPEMRKMGEDVFQGVKDAYPAMANAPSLEDIIGKTVLTQNLTIDEDPLLFYASTEMFHEANPYFYSRIGKKNLEKLRKPGVQVLFLSKNINYKLPFQETIENIRDESTRKHLESIRIEVVKKGNWSDDIDLQRHRKTNRWTESIYHVLENNPTFTEPEKLLEYQEYEGQIRDINQTSLEVYKTLLEKGISKNKAFQVIPRTLEFLVIESMDMINVLNKLALRTCTQARPNVQEYARQLTAIVRGQIFRGFDENILPRGMQQGYCSEKNTCKACGEIKYLYKG